MQFKIDELDKVMETLGEPVVRVGDLMPITLYGVAEIEAIIGEYWRWLWIGIGWCV